MNGSKDGDGHRLRYWDTNLPKPNWEDRVKRIHEGDDMAAANLLTVVADLLEENRYVPAAVRRYLAASFRRITNSADPAREAPRALGLRRQRGKQSKVSKVKREFKAVAILDDLAEELRDQKSPPSENKLLGEPTALERAIRTVGQRHGVSPRQIYRYIAEFVRDEAPSTDTE